MVNLAGLRFSPSCVVSEFTLNHDAPYLPAGSSVRGIKLERT